MLDQNLARERILSILGIFFILAACFLSAPVAQAMPLYERLPSITDRLNAPKSVALDSQENLYVTDIRNNRLVIYTQSGKLRNTLDKLDKPTAVAVDSLGQVYIANKGRGNVEVYNPDLVLLRRLGFDDHQFSNPTAIAIDSLDTIYVADAGDDVIKVFLPDGTFSFSFGGTGSVDGKFNFPTSIAIDEAAGEIIVSDLKEISSFFGPSKGARVQVFDMSGLFDRSFGDFGALEGKLVRPMGVEVDGAGRIYVADSFKSVVIVYDGFGAYTGTIYNPDSPRIPVGLALGRSNRLFIPSLSVSRVDVYGLDPFIHMDVAPLSLAFEGEQNGPPPDLQAVVIQNNGSATLNWTSRSDEAWIQTPGPGSIGPYSSATVDVGVGLAGLNPGEYTGSLEIEAESGATEVVAVNLTVQPQRELSVSPLSLGFSAVVDFPPPSQSLSIENIGGGTLQWNASSDRTWIVLDKSSGTAPDTVSVSIDVSSLGAGTYTGTVTVTGDQALNSPAAVPVTIDITEVLPVIIAGAGHKKGNTASVRTFLSDGSETGTAFIANSYIYGVNVASGDVNSDGIDEIITAPGPGSKNPAEINVFDRSGGYLEEFTSIPFPYIFGAYVASADFDRDGYDEIIAGAGPEQKTPAHVKILTYDSQTQTLVESGIDFLAYDAVYGALVAAGDVDGDGTPELITAPGPGPSNTGIIRIWSIDTSSGRGQWSLSLMKEFTVNTGYKHSVTIAAGDVNNDGLDEIITGNGPSEKAKDMIRVFNRDGVMLSIFEAGVTNGHGANVACGDTDSDGIADIVTGAGPDPHNPAVVQVFDVSGNEKVRFTAFDTTYGVNIAVGQ